MRYEFKTRPYAHQVAALKNSVEGFRVRNSHALLMDPRTGKTKVAVDAAALLHQAGKCDRVLVVCPVSVIPVWEQEIAAHCPCPHRVVVWDKRGRRRTSLPPASSKLTFVIVNYDAFSTPGRRNPRTRKRSRSVGGRFTVRKTLMAWKPHFMILDESHRIKQHSAKKSKMIRVLGRYVDYRMILTGTVLTKRKRLHDIYSQWMFLNPNSPMVLNHTADTFKHYYGRFLQRDGYQQWVGNRHESELRSLLHAEAFAVRRDECFDLPPRRSQIVPVELSGHNAELYDEMAQEMVARLKTGEITEAAIKIVQTLRLAQLTSGITKTTPTYEHPEARLVRVGKDKLLVLEELLDDLFQADEKVVVGARWRGDIAAISALCRRLKTPVYELHGGIKQRSRMPEHIQPFNRRNGAACLVMQPSAGGLGIDLSAASIFIWFSLTNSWVDYTQAEDRIALSSKSTMYMYLLAKATVDELMYDTLQEDGNLARAVTDSPDRLLRNFKRKWIPKQRR